MSDSLWKERVAGQRIRLGLLAGIDIRLASVAGGIDEKAGFCLAQEFQQEIIPCVIQFFASKRGERLLPFTQSLRERLANITATAEENSHDGMWWSRLASAITLSRYARYSQFGSRRASACNCASERNPWRNAASSGQPIFTPRRFSTAST